MKMNGYLFCAFFTLCSALFAQETRVEIVFKDGTSIKGVLLNYGERTYQIQINGKIQTFSEKDIQRVCFEDKEGSTNQEKPVSSGAPENTSSKDEGVMKNLDSKVTLDFNETPLGDVLSFFQAVANLNMVIDPDVDVEIPISLTVMDIDIKTALSLLRLLAPITVGVKKNVIIISKSAHNDPTIFDVAPVEVCPLEAIQKKYPEVFQKLRSTQMTLNFKETPITDVVSFLRDVSEQNILIHPIVLKPGFEKKLSIDIVVQQLDLYTVFELIENILKLEFVLVNREVLVLQLPHPSKMFELEEKSLLKEVDAISNQLRESIIALEIARDLKAIERKLKEEEEEISVLHKKENSQEIETRMKRLKELRKKYELQSMDWSEKYHSMDVMKEKYQIAMESFLKMQHHVKEDENLYKMLAEEEQEHFLNAWKEAEKLFQKLKAFQK